MNQPNAAETAAITMLTRLDHVIRASLNYPSGHAALAHASHGIGEELERMLDKRESVELFVMEDFVCSATDCSAPVRATAQPFGRSARLEATRFTGLEVAYVDEDQIQPLVRLLLEFPGRGGPGPDVLNRELASRGQRHLVFLTPTATDIEVIDEIKDPDSARFGCTCGACEWCTPSSKTSSHLRCESSCKKTRAEPGRAVLDCAPTSARTHPPQRTDRRPPDPPGPHRSVRHRGGTASV